MTVTSPLYSVSHDALEQALHAPQRERDSHLMHHHNTCRSVSRPSTPVQGKAELIHRRTWKTREAVEPATLTWGAWFNNQRLMGPLCDIPPAEAEANYQLTESSVAPT